MRKLQGYHEIYIGCDPEFFFAKKGQVLGAEKILPEEGLIYKPGSDKKRDGDYTSKEATISKIIIDGVQAELNPRPNTCRANLGNEISACFRKLYTQIKENKSLQVEFSQVKEVSKKELDSLSEKARVFGCTPSRNTYSKEENKITVNPATYKYRSAGGHIHLGYRSGGEIKEALLEKRDRVVQMLDIVLGNTCVLIDRDPYAAERRKVYGRAGDYRAPSYGIEYRTLSNFWLKSYQLMGLVTGLARMAVEIVAYSENGCDYEKAILNKVNMKKIVEAINNNDFNSAYENHMKIEGILLEILPTYSDYYPISSETIEEFHHFLNGDLGHWFKEDPFQHWIHLPEGHGTGWESYLKNDVRKDMVAHKLNEDKALAYWAE